MDADMLDNIGLSTPVSATYLMNPLSTVVGGRLHRGAPQAVPTGKGEVDAFSNKVTMMPVRVASRSSTHISMS
jgi:hypothetical protein